jgi:hypothetical protein
MATTTPNYGWDVPTSSDYVKLGAVAIETLGDDIDATLWTALGGNYPGLRLVKQQTIGTGVSSVTVTGAFSTTYKNYKIMIADGTGNGNNFLGFRLGAANTDYYQGLTTTVYASGVALLDRQNNTALWGLSGWISADAISLNVDLVNPFLAKRTFIGSPFAGTSVAGSQAGVHNANTSFTDFTLVPNSGGTMTGGTIYVYGYGAS